MKRLRTLLEYEELGAGFHIAMKDLEIRGAGNLLGAEQSGHINAIGFELYTKILEETVREEKEKIEGTFEKKIDGENFIERMKKIKIETDIDSYLPEDYIEDSEQRVEIYRRISSIRNPAEIEEVKEELTDRYGSLPVPARALLLIISLKLLAFKLKINKISIHDALFHAWFDIAETSKIKEKEQFLDKISTFLNKAIFPFTFIQGKNLGMKLELGDLQSIDKLENAEEFLISIAEE